MSYIDVENLTKTYFVKHMKPNAKGAIKSLFKRDPQTITALDNVSFSIKEHELMGYIGPNGAGKSTTMKILSGILVPDSGTVHVMGRVPYKQRKEHVANIGVVFGQRTQLWWDVPVIESYKLLGDIFKVDKKRHKRTMEELIDVMDAKDLLQIPLRKLSLGQRMRCELIASLLHTPKLLFLDEPTIGLDAVSKIKLREFIKEQNKKRGTTILLTTHDMADIEQLCTRVMVIGKGKILFEGSIEKLRKQYAPFRYITIHTDNPNRLNIPETKIIQSDAISLKLEYNPEKLPTTDLIARLNNYYNVKDLTVENPDIERVISSMYEGEGL